ncbi:ABC transporter permease [Trueperella pyogenes]|nr:ABC transporter permease [Trueperella pyogenes]AWG03799.1 ribose ABC transporter permease [Trueperella pyogenes]AWG16530.1 ribose ABC transporter permease [Trueperella pyogenes]AZR05408.1 ABC transporter permease [Trueperella pyogenes]
MLYFRRHASQVLVLVSEIILIVGFSLASPYFFQINNFSALLLDASVYILLALGLTFVIATGGIDLTPGFGIAFTGVCLAVAMKWSLSAGLPVWVCILIGVIVGIASGAVLGAVNGVMVAYLNMQPMIATLAMMLVAWGLAMVLSGTSAIPLTEFGTFLKLGQGRTFGLTNAVYLILIAALAAAFLLNRTLIGRYALAMGSNEEATRLSGVNVPRWKFRVYMLAGSFTGLAGVLMASRLASGKPDVGQSYEMYAIAAAVLGGASLRGGKASVFGSVIGAILIATIRNGAVLMGIPDQWQKVLLGVVVLAAVYLDTRRRDQ